MFCAEDSDHPRGYMMTPPSIEQLPTIEGDARVLQTSRDVREQQRDHGLPVEMLMEVFRMCGDEDSPPNHKPSPLFLSHVCFWWRKIVVGSPLLWRSFYIPFRYRTRTDGVTHLLRIWLDHSRGSYVRLNITLGDYSYLPPTLVPLIADNLHQFNHIHLSMPKRLLQPLLNVKYATADGLVTLSIKDSRVFVDAQSTNNGMLGFDSASSLRNITVHLLCSFTRRSFVRVPWHQLELMEMEGICPSIAGPHILSGCTELVECKLTIGDWVQETGLHMALKQGIVIERLRDLEITFRTHGVCSTFLEVLTLPCLRVLAVTILDDIDDWPRLVFADIQLRSHFSLVEFRVRCTRLRTDDMCNILRLNETLRRLCITDSGCATSQLYDDLTVSGARHSLVPSLEHIEVRGATGLVPYTVAADMMISRMTGELKDGDIRSARLLSAVVTVNPSWNGPLLERQMSLFESMGFLLDIL